METVSAVLTQLIHYYDFVSAHSTAAVVIDVLPPLEVLTFDTLPASTVAFGCYHTEHKMLYIMLVSLVIFLIIVT